MTKNHLLKKLWLIAASLAAGTMLANDCQMRLRDSFTMTTRTAAQCLLDPFNFGLSGTPQGNCRPFF